MIVARRIVNLNINFLATDVLYTFIDVEDSRLVFVIEQVVQVVCDQRRLANRGVADKYELEALWSSRVRSWYLHWYWIWSWYWYWYWIWFALLYDRFIYWLIRRHL